MHIDVQLLSISYLICIRPPRSEEKHEVSKFLVFYSILVCGCITDAT